MWRKCNPSTWSSNIRGMWRLTFYPRNPYEATGMVKRPWDQQVFFFQIPPNVHFFYQNVSIISIVHQSWSILINTTAGADREVFWGRGSSANDKAFLPGITAFLTRYRCISHQLLLYFFPGIIVFLACYYCISSQIFLYISPGITVFVQFSSAGQWS